MSVFCQFVSSLYSRQRLVYAAWRHLADMNDIHIVLISFLFLSFDEQLPQILLLQPSIHHH